MADFTAMSDIVIPSRTGAKSAVKIDAVYEITHGETDNLTEFLSSSKQENEPAGEWEPTEGSFFFRSLAAACGSDAVIPGHAKREPGISRFRFDADALPRNDGARTSRFIEKGHPKKADARPPFMAQHLRILPIREETKCPRRSHQRLKP
ncbi:hypothetical protein [Bradyrhizobium sp. ARR65]|uniref:hypothetical protein n=1 Tax=Bradyrhizobium sp. ARR65 TaxID=1040989 RepID=UPI0012F82212|nr:hypothetical protein [Bradyrhizobium sp. ARR65]